jgi:hypothetical protein
MSSTPDEESKKTSRSPKKRGPQKQKSYGEGPEQGDRRGEQDKPSSTPAGKGNGRPRERDPCRPEAETEQE